MAVEFNLQPILEDELVLMRPLQEGDRQALYAVAADPEIWEQHPAKERSEPAGFNQFFEGAIQSGAAFLVINKSDGDVIGTSRYNLVAESEKAIEIGWTFLAKKYWGAGYNGHIKNLMIEHAFTSFDMVIFYIHQDNIRSQKAVEKIGGKRITTVAGIELSPRPTASVNYAIYKGDWLDKQGQ